MKKILAIDDQHDNLVAIRGFLKNFLPNCQLFMAQSGKEGIAIAQKEQPDTILLDIIMPEMDGFEVCKILKQDDRTKFIPILMLSALGNNQESRIRGLSLGADAFIAKPFIHTELQAQINVMLRIKETEDKLRIRNDELEKLVLLRAKKIAETETKFKNITERIRDIIVISSLDGVISYVSPSISRNFDYSPEEVIGKNISNFVTEQEFANVTKSLKIVKSGKNIEDIHSVFIKKDGNIANISISAIPVYEGDEVVGTQSVIRDITLSKKAQEDLKQSEKDFKALFNNTSDAIYIQSKDFLFIDVNKGAIDMYGYPKEYFMGKTPEFLGAPGKNDMEKAIKYLEDALAGIPQQYEFWGIRKNGEIFPKIVRSRLGSYKGQEVVITSAIDITGIKNAQEKLNRSEELYRNVFNNAPLGIIHFDINGIITRTNDEFLRILGSTYDKIVGLDLLNQLKDPEMINAIKNTLAEGFGYYNNDYTSVTANKTTSIVIHFKAIHNSHNKIIGGVGIVEDITERLLAEKKQKESERKLSTLLNNLQGIAYRCKNDKSWTMEFLSDGIYDITGYKPEYFIDNKEMEYAELIIPEDRQRIWDEVQTAINKKEKYELSFQIKTKSGELKHVSEKGIGVFNKETGELIALEGFISDVTPQVIAVSTLKESEERNRSITETAADAIISIDDEGIILSWNKAAEEIFGYLADEMINKDLSVIIPDMYKNEHNKGIARLKDGGEKRLIGKTTEIIAVRKNGVVFPIELSLSSWEANGQKFYTSIIRDITKRKLIDDELMQLSTAVEQSPSVIAITNLLGNIEYVNPKFSELTGYSREDVIGENPRILKSNEQSEEVYRNLWQTIIKGEVWHGEFHNRKKNGELFWERASISAIHDKSGNIINYLKVAEDITERKKADSIQKVLYNISNAVNTSDDLVHLISIVQKELHKIIDTSNFYIALYDADSNSFSLPFLDDDKDDITYFDAGKTLSYQVVKTKKALLITKDEVRKLIEEKVIEQVGTQSEVWLGVPLNVEGVVSGVLAVQSYTNKNAYNELDMKMLEFVSDQIGISINRKRTEDNLKLALHNATESDRLKSTFLATISHELRTPLNAIIGFSELIISGLPLGDTIDYGRTINSSGQHLLSIVDDIFDITLIQTGRTKINKRDTNIHTTLLEVNNYIKAEEILHNNENLNLELIIPENAYDLVVNTDLYKLKQILINLLKNALKFTDQGFVKYGYEIETINGQQMIKFSVSDTGIGIAKDMYDSIFEAFRQIDDSVTRKYGGMGIGLSISKKLVELLGGELWFKSELGVGSTFYFTIPYEEAAKVETYTKDEIVLPSLKGKTILIVEDDIDSLEYLKIILKQVLVTTIWVKKGKEAVKVCAENANIDLVLMDINMYGMNGLVATQKIKEFRPNLPIIAQTALAIAGDKEKALEAGCDDYISKPINKVKLFKLIEKHIS